MIYSILGALLTGCFTVYLFSVENTVLAVLMFTLTCMDCWWIGQIHAYNKMESQADEFWSKVREK